MVPYLAKAACAVGIDGLFLETHPDPEKALSDGPNMVSTEDLPGLLKAVMAIQAVQKRLNMVEITNIKAIECLDSRGLPGVLLSLSRMIVLVMRRYHQ